MERTTGRDDAADSDKPYRGRRLSWTEFETLTGRLRPAAANDNQPADSPPTPARSSIAATPLLGRAA